MKSFGSHSQALSSTSTNLACIKWVVEKNVKKNKFTNCRITSVGQKVSMDAPERAENVLSEIGSWVSEAWKAITTHSILKGFHECGYIKWDGNLD